MLLKKKYIRKLDPIHKPDGDDQGQLSKGSDARTRSRMFFACPHDPVGDGNVGRSPENMPCNERTSSLHALGEGRRTPRVSKFLTLLYQRAGGCIHQRRAPTRGRMRWG